MSLRSARASSLLAVAYLLPALAACHPAPPTTAKRLAPSAALAAPATPLAPAPVPTPEPTPAPPPPQIVRGVLVEAQPPLDPLPAESDKPASGDAIDNESEATEDEAAAAPLAAQKEALELCQEASTLLSHGEVDAALHAVDRAYEKMLALPNNGDETYLQAKEDIRLLAAELIHRAYTVNAPAGGKPRASWDLGLALVDNEHVQREIRSFTNGEREQFLQGVRRSGRYRPMILAKLEAAGLPAQLSWLPLVESWFKERALSRAAAYGMWQFIASTGLRYGLSRDTWIDERLDPEKATDAAIGYLGDLHGYFGDWMKALAAYNCGEARLLRLGRRSDAEYLDFWDLYEQLPLETRRYVPRLLAAIQIIENPERYGMVLPTPDPPLSGLTLAQVEKAVDLQKLDEALGLATSTLADLNPELRLKATPNRPYALRVPEGVVPQLGEKVASLPTYSKPAGRSGGRGARVGSGDTYRVRAGDTLSRIAAMHGTTVARLRAANGLRTDALSIGQRLRIP